MYIYICIYIMYMHIYKIWYDSVQLIGTWNFSLFVEWPLQKVGGLAQLQRFHGCSKTHAVEALYQLNLVINGYKCGYYSINGAITDS